MTRHNQPLDPGEEIFKALHDEEKLLDQLKEDIRLGVPSRVQLDSCTSITRLDLEHTHKGSAALRRTTYLLKEHSQSIDDWVDNGNFTSKYFQYKQTHTFNELHRIQRSLIRTTTARALELHAIHTRVRGHKASRRFIGCLNQRWKVINKDIKEFNDLIKNIPEHLRPSPLTPKEIKEKGVTLDSFWDIDRVQINEDWAISSEVREGIEASLRVNRAQEEIKRIQLEVDRVVAWLETQAEVLSVTDEWMTPWIRLKVQHLYRIIRSFDKAQIEESSKARIKGWSISPPLQQCLQLLT